MTLLALLTLAVFGAGFTVGTVYEGCRRGGTLDMHIGAALANPPRNVTIVRQVRP